MELSVDLFEKSLADLRAGGVRNTDDRRTAARVAVRARIFLRPVIDGRLGEPVSVLSRDISEAGLGIMSPYPMQTDAHYVLVLKPEREDGRQRIVLYCTVKNCWVLTDGLYGIGFSCQRLVSSAAGHSSASAHAIQV